MKTRVVPLIAVPLILASLTLAATAMAAEEAAVPDAMVGTWAREGACGDPAARLVIGPAEAQLGETAPRAIVYRRDEPGEGLLAWAGGGEETFSYDATEDLVLRRGPEGSESFKRCE